MVKYYELLDLTNDDGPRAMINAREEGEWAKRADMEKALALISEMQDMLRNYQPCCMAEYDDCVALFARAEELLRD